LARASEAETYRFRQGIAEILNSSMVAAMSAVHDHSQSILESLANGKTNGKDPSKSY
jgi:hypothetical protein